MKNKTVSILLFLFALAVFIFLFQKARVSSFTSDESFTYNYYVHSDFMDILSHKHPYSNNHLLNTMMMKYSEKLFGSSELALRLPNLMAYWIFFIYFFMLLKKQNLAILVSSVVLVLANAFFIDFFALARGYGLSFGFMMAAIYYLEKGLESRKNRAVILFHIASVLAILSNFTMLNLYIAGLITWGISNFVTRRNEKISFFKVNRIHFFCIPAALLILYEPVRRVLTYNHFDFAGKNGFFRDTVSSLTDTLFSRPQFSDVTTIAVNILLMITVIYPLICILPKPGTNKNLVVCTLILSLMLLAIVLQHVLFQSDYPGGRLSLYLFPLFVLQLALLIGYFSERTKWLSCLPVFLGIYASVAFMRQANLYNSGEWKYDSQTKNAMKALVADHEKNRSDEKIKLGCTWLFEPTLNFYRQTWQLNWLDSIKRNSLGTDNHYYYFQNTEQDSLPEMTAEVIFSSEASNSTLARKTD